jgi:hypothetical protein
VIDGVGIRIQQVDDVEAIFQIIDRLLLLCAAHDNDNDNRNRYAKQGEVPIHQ